MLRRVLVCLLITLPAYSYHNLDLVAGTGATTASARQQNYLAGFGTAKAETADAVSMRETLFFGLRYTNYTNAAGPGFLAGGEISTLMASPSTSGSWRFGQYDADGRLTSGATQAFNSGSAPGFNLMRGSLHVGFSIPIGGVLAPEIGALVGIGYGESKYTYQSPVSSALNGGTSNGKSGLSAHAGLRFAVKLIAIETLAVGIEYRYLTEVMGSIFSFSPGLQSDSSSASLSGHMLLVSVGFRFGLPARAADGT